MDEEEVVIRSIVPEDRAGLVAIMSETYGQYNPYWDDLEDWLHDTSGLSLVADVAGELAGFGRVAKLASDPDEWWVESLATTANQRRRGIARQLAIHGLQLWSRAQRGALRAMVSNYNEATFGLLEQVQFATAQIFEHYTAGVLDGADELEPVTPANLDRALAVIEGSRLLRIANDLVERRWRWQRFTRAMLERFVGEGQALLWRGGAGLACFWTRQGSVEPELRIWFADTLRADRVELLRAIRAHASRCDVARAGDKPIVIHCRIPDDATAASEMRAAGFARRETYESRFHVVEYRCR